MGHQDASPPGAGGSGLDPSRDPQKPGARDPRDARTPPPSSLPDGGPPLGGVAGTPPPPPRGGGPPDEKDGGSEPL
jgi:hypothetical protein